MILMDDRDEEDQVEYDSRLAPALEQALRPSRLSGVKPDWPAGTRTIGASRLSSQYGLEIPRPSLA